jgi:hypothetical protein
MDGRSAALGILVLLLSSAAAPCVGAGFWTLGGRVFDGSDCMPLMNATLSSAYDGNAYNLSGRDGSYLLLLGTGNWLITASKAGYSGESYEAPYLQGGAQEHDFYLIRDGAAPLNCSSPAYPMANGSMTEAVTEYADANAQAASGVVQGASVQLQESHSPSPAPWIAALGLAALWVGAALHYAIRDREWRKSRDKEAGRVDG